MCDTRVLTRTVQLLVNEWFCNELDIFDVQDCTWEERHISSIILPNIWKVLQNSSLKDEHCDVKRANQRHWPCTNSFHFYCCIFCTVEDTNCFRFAVKNLDTTLSSVELRSWERALSFRFCVLVRWVLPRCSLFRYKSVKQHGRNASPFNNARYTLTALCRGLYWKQARSLSAITWHRFEFRGHIKEGAFWTCGPYE